MTDEPIDLTTALSSFDALWSPRIVTRVNDYDVRIAKVAGEHIWHAHDDTDEFFLVLDGELRIALRDREDQGDPEDQGDREDRGDRREGRGEAEAGQRVVTLPAGAVFVVPRGVEHRPFSPDGASILMFEPAGTATVGDRHEAVPDHIDVTAGHELDRPAPGGFTP
ncbi:cupin [Planobispora rosea]|uniref:Cupin n=1 Tax=Planobispora rosea TaxID=35762 RepID=A0A8J3S3Y6_PLARO|nr:cupin domain-containing protein [Planobispora rosea]GGS94413.1 cupin [Planobispora rosea]GIH87322.1 cupin [Planobispora rosea]